MILHILGSGAPIATAQRYGTCFVLEIGEDRLMFDCGPAATYKLVRMGMRPTQVGRLFFTHHHFDHNVDTPCFLLSRWDEGGSRETPLHVFGPPPTCSFIERLIGPAGAYREDIVARQELPASQLLYQQRGGTLPRPAPTCHAQDVEGGFVEKGNNWTATAWAVHHAEPWFRSLAWRVDSPEGSVVFTGDAGPCDALAGMSRGAATLVICCAYAGTTHPAMADAVTGASDAGRIAREAGVRTVVLTHSSAEMGSPGRREAVVAEVARAFDGRIIFADELVSIAL